MLWGGTCVNISILKIGRRLREDLLGNMVAEVTRDNQHIFVNIHSLGIPEILDLCNQTECRFKLLLFEH